MARLNEANTGNDRDTGPSTDAVAITPHDTNAISGRPRAVFVGTGGNITLRALDSSADVLLSNVQDGAILPIRPSHVRATGTTATGLVALL